MINIQTELQKIHAQFATSEMANYKIQLLCEQYAELYHESKSKQVTETPQNDKLILFARFISNNSKLATWMTSSELLEEFEKDLNRKQSNE